MKKKSKKLIKGYVECDACGDIYKKDKMVDDLCLGCDQIVEDHAHRLLPERL